MDRDVGGSEGGPHEVGVAAEPVGGVLRLGEKAGGRLAILGAGGGDGAGEEQAPVDGQQALVDTGAEVGLQHARCGVGEFDAGAEAAGGVQRVGDRAKQ